MQTRNRCWSVSSALLVTFLWSTSWVLIKRGLNDIPALTFAGLRYGLAFLILAPGLWKHRDEVRRLSLRDWLWLAVLGVVFYALTQGAQFLTLRFLDAIPFSLALSFTPMFVGISGSLMLHEHLRPIQWIGILAMLGGALVYFLFGQELRGTALGFAFAGIALASNTASSLLGRSINRRKFAHPIVVTGISMGIGAVLLLGAGLATQGIPTLSAANWGIVVWLAAVNTAFAFTLWNRSLRSLTATESSVINNTMLIQIAILAWIFLGERLSILQIGGLLLAAAGALLVQLRKRQRDPLQRADEYRS